MPWDFWLIFFVLSVLVPWRGHARLRELLAKPQVDSRERLALYISTIVFQWIAAAVAGWRAWARGFTRAQLGLALDHAATVAALAVAGAALLGGLQWLNLRRMSRILRENRGQMQALAERILPRTPVERLTFLLLAATAGLCEEFLYRGFAMAAFSRAGLPVWLIVLCSSVLFGLAHLYQGKGGFVTTTMLGVIFGTARASWISLAPVMIWHMTVDCLAGIAGPKYLLSEDAGDAVTSAAVNM
jgi:uncharacterized protein